MNLDNIENLPAFDVESTRNMRTMLGQEFDDIVDEFIDTTPQLIQALASAIQHANDDEIISLAHRLKSGSANLGMTAFSMVCKYLEEGMRTGERIDFEKALNLVYEQFDRLKAA